MRDSVLCLKAEQEGLVEEQLLESKVTAAERAPSGCEGGVMSRRVVSGVHRISVLRF